MFAFENVYLIDIFKEKETANHLIININSIANSII